MAKKWYDCGTMTIPLLITKLYIPPPRPNLVPRPRLIERLDEGLRLGRKLALISAPAGFGKTTLSTEWLYSKDREVSSRSVAWLSLDEGDNDPARFFNYLTAALRQLDEDVGQATQSLLGSPQMPPTESLATTLINDIAAIPNPFVLVLDDYQLIHNTPIHDALAFLLDHQPPHMHLLIATRTDPPLSLPRLRVRGHMTEIREDDLRFTEEEAETFLNQALGLALDAEKVAALEARTEGWIAGLQLAALSMQNQEDIAGFVNAFSGSNRHVIDYLAEEVLAQQPEEIRDFLHQTSILDRFCASLCDAVIKADDSADRPTDQSPPRSFDESQSTLERLERQNLFLVPLDDRREWYRYHRLFADFLHSEIDPAQASNLQVRAARWFEAHGLMPEAAKHALASKSTDEAVRIVVPAAYEALRNGELVTILGWLNALPDEAVRANSWLASFKAWSLIATGQSESGESYIQSAEATLGPDASPLDRGRVLSLRCPLAEPADKIRIAQEALDMIGDADPLSRGNTLFMLGDAQDAVGDVVGAVETFREAYQVAQQHGFDIIAAAALGHLAISLNEQGRRREAVAVCQQGAAQYVDAQGRPLPITGLIHIVLGELAYEANDLDQAHHYIQAALELGKQSALTIVVLYATEALAKVQYALGNEEKALATIQETQRLARRLGDHMSADADAALEADLRLRQGDILFAERWAESAAFPTGKFPHVTDRHEFPTYARLLLAQGHPEKARALLTQREGLAKEDGRHRSLITIHILQALTEHMLGHEAAALTYLERALRLAALEDYARAFLEEDPTLAQLLPHARHVAPGFVDKLLTAFGAAPPPPRTLRLVEPLSERELQVLRLMVADLSAPEIAEELVIAASTVRSHIKNIYGKLNAHSRYEAVERARELDLI
jgi:LuxR family maltose regulon positive regulatory protein